MYCSQCGCQLPDNSNFCSSCGYKINSVISIVPQKDGAISILSVSKGNLILYLAWWSLAALACLIFIWVDNESILPALFVLPIYVGIPLIVYTIFRKKEKDKDKDKKQSNNCDIPKDEPHLSASIKFESKPNEMPLLDFANEFGKMQVCKTADKNGRIHSKCIFTKVTEVTFAESLGELTACEISENKQQLVVSKTAEGQYELTLKRGTTLNKATDSELPPPVDKISE